MFFAGKFQNEDFFIEPPDEINKNKRSILILGNNQYYLNNSKFAAKTQTFHYYWICSAIGCTSRIVTCTWKTILSVTKHIDHAGTITEKKKKYKLVRQILHDNVNNRGLNGRDAWVQLVLDHPALAESVKDWLSVKSLIQRFGEPAEQFMHSICCFLPMYSVSNIHVHSV